MARPGPLGKKNRPLWQARTSHFALGIAHVKTKSWLGVFTVASCRFSSNSSFDVTHSIFKIDLACCITLWRDATCKTAVLGNFCPKRLSCGVRSFSKPYFLPAAA
jgi:hypothetical protein